MKIYNAFKTQLIFHFFLLKKSAENDLIWSGPPGIFRTFFLTGSLNKKLRSYPGFGQYYSEGQAIVALCLWPQSQRSSFFAF